MARIKREIKLITLDTETIGLDGALKRIAIHDGYRTVYGYTFEDVEPELIRWYRLGYSVHVYIHNLEFDARKIPKLLCKENTNWNQTIQIDGRYAKIACKYYTVHDSWRLLPKSLANLSKDFDLEHGKLDLWKSVQEHYPGQYENHVDFLNKCDPDDPIYLEYLGYDVISLYELLYKLLEVTGLTERELVNRLSTASLSKYLFRVGYKGKPFKTEGESQTDFEIMTSMKAWSSTKEINNNLSSQTVSYLDIENKIREGYFGGRTEVFTTHAKRISETFNVLSTEYRKEMICAYHLDVNSLYPSVMIDNEYPIGYPTFYDDSTIIKGLWDEWLNYHSGLGYIKAVVYIPKQFIPPLPAHMGKLVFPTGYVEGTWTYNELEYAVKNCGVEVLEFKEMIHFKHTFKVFHNFVKFFYDMKDEGKRTGNASLTALAKLILNTAYGWTVLRRDDKTELKNIDEKEKYMERFNYEDEELGFINIDSTVFSDSIQPQVGAYVTSYARLILLDMLRRQSEKGTVYYCDTDSIVCDTMPPAEYVDKYAIGKWDLEAELYEGLFLMPKVYYEVKPAVWDDKSSKYVWKNTVKFKGVSKDTQKQFDYDFYWNIYERLARGDTGTLLVEKDKELLRSISYAHKKGFDPNRLEYRDKNLNLGNVQKRKMDYEANTSEAWHMENLDMFHNFSFRAPIVPWDTMGDMFDPCAQAPRKERKKA